MAKEAYIEKDECTSCGQCVDDLPDVFRMDSDDIAEVYNSEGASEDEIQESMQFILCECRSEGGMCVNA